MSIVAISRDYGNNPSIVRIVATDDFTEITSDGYLTSQAANIFNVNGGAFQWRSSDSVLIYYNTSAPYYTDGSSLVCTVTPDFSTLIPMFSLLTPADIQSNKFNYAVDTGTANAIVAAFDPPNASLTDGQVFWIKVAADNTLTNPTVNIDGLGAKLIKKSDGSAVSAADMTSGNQYQFEWNLVGNFMGLMNPDSIYSGGGGTVTAQDIQNNTFTFAADTNFTADAYVTAPSPAWTSYQPSQTLYMFSNTPNLTDSPTLNVNGLGAINIKLLGGDPVSPGDIGYGISVFQINNNANQAILLNPANTYRLIPGLNQGIVFSAADSGVADTYAGTYPLSAFSNLLPSQGTFIYLLVANTNTGASTFQLNPSAPGSSAYPIVTAGGAALTAGQMVAGYFAQLIYTGSAQYQLLNPAV